VVSKVLDQLVQGQAYFLLAPRLDDLRILNLSLQLRRVVFDSWRSLMLIGQYNLRTSLVFSYAVTSRLGVVGGQLATLVLLGKNF